MPRIVESLKQDGIFYQGSLEAEDIIIILQSYAEPDTTDAVLKTYATIAKQDIAAEAAPDESLKLRVENAIAALTQQNKNKALFLIEYVGHFYLGVAKRNDDDSIKLEIHDIRDADSGNKTNQTLVANIFKKTAGQAAQEYQNITFDIADPLETKRPDDKEWDGKNCGDLVIVRGLQEMGFESFTDNIRFSEIENATQLRQLVIKEAIDAEGLLANSSDDADPIEKQNIEFMSTKEGIAALNKNHKDYRQIRNRLTQQSRSSTQASKQPSSYSWLNLLKKNGVIATELKDNVKKQEAFYKANQTMEKILERNLNQVTFERCFDQMADAVKDGNPDTIKPLNMI